MCGIVGVVHLNSQGNAGSFIKEMVSALRHRGPNDEGYLLANIFEHRWESYAGIDTLPELRLDRIPDLRGEGNFDLALGHRRLSILDLSAFGHGPMAYGDGSFWITYNGEIYNYLELRRELKNRGYGFFTNTDTEVILAAYSEWGIECLKYFNGMWAFALWDVNKNRLFCARDRFGVKPFHYYWDGSFFVFASEIKALLQHPVVSRRPNESVIYDYLVPGSLDHTEETFFENIYRLLPAHYLVLDLRNRSLHCQRWWDVQTQTSAHLTDADDSEAVERFRELLIDAVRLRLRSDVPVGTNLSGGLDSSSIVCIANKLILEERAIPQELVGDRQKTFTAYFEDPAIDERPFVQQIIDRTNAESNLVSPKGSDGLWRELEQFVWCHEEPVASTSPYSQWNVMRLAAQRGVTVLLDGQGGDEILAGYHYYFGPYLIQLCHTMGLGKAISVANQISTRNGISLPYLGALGTLNILPARMQSIITTIAGQRFRKNPTVSVSLLNPQFIQRFSQRAQKYAKHSGYSDLKERLYSDIFTHSLPALLRYEDRNSMAFSLEARVPFLDFRLVEFTFSLPADMLIREGWTKWILRQASGGLLPENIRWRKSKLGFATPEKDWLKEGATVIQNELRLSKAPLDGYLNFNRLNSLINSESSNLDQVPGLWRLLNLAVWFRLFIGSDFNLINNSDFSKQILY